MKRLPTEHFDREPDAVTVTRHGKPVMAILPWELYETLIETLEVMSDAELMAAFRQGVQELTEGKGQSWDNVKRDWACDRMADYFSPLQKKQLSAIMI